ncbi:MAG TPA: EamA family transporter [Flavobacteriaceae bacterium]|nr:EamA family transporter [Flavobacteriaceae bacterium]
MENNSVKWMYLLVLSLVWGSSFILIKKALLGLTPLQIGSLRILIAAVFLLIIGFRRLKKIKKNEWKWIIASGVLGTFIPSFLFPLAQTEIDSSISSILNTITPLMTLVFGFFIFSISFTKRQLFGLVIGFLGGVLLILQGAEVNPNQNYLYTLFILAATVCYALNLNLIKTKLQEVSSLAIAVGCFSFLMIPAFVVLLSTGFFSKEVLFSTTTSLSILYVALLGVFGTALALLFFNKLIQVSSPVFSSSVTYFLPIVALFWGVLDGETLTLTQIMAAVFILFGVVLANRKRKQKTAPI